MYYICTNCLHCIYTNKLKKTWLCILNFAQMFVCVLFFKQTIAFFTWPFHKICILTIILSWNSHFIHDPFMKFTFYLWFFHKFCDFSVILSQILYFCCNPLMKFEFFPQYIDEICASLAILWWKSCFCCDTGKFAFLSRSSDKIHVFPVNLWQNLPFFTILWWN